MGHHLGGLGQAQVVRTACSSRPIGRACTWDRAIPNQHWLGKKGFASSPEKKDLRVLVDEKLGMSVTCTHSSESQPCPWLHHKKHYQQVKGSDSFSLPFSLMTSYLEYCIHPWGSNIRRRWMCWKESREGH